MNNSEDIAEYALTYGKKAVMSKFDITGKQATEAVYDFIKDVSESCSCVEAGKQGIAQMCFMCSGRKVSLSLRERLEKAGFGNILNYVL